MSKPLQEEPPGPDDLEYYAPRKTRSEGDSHAIQPAETPEQPPESDADDWTPRYHNDEFSVPFPKAPGYLDGVESDSRRAGIGKKIAIAIGAGAILIAAGVAFFDTVKLAKTRDDAPTIKEPDVPLASRLETAAADLKRASPPVVTPTLIVAESTGDMNTPLPLGLDVQNYTADAAITLAGLPQGTMLTVGTPQAGGQWRIAIEDLANARVNPPNGYVGVMNIMAELRTAAGVPIVRSPLRLTWRQPPPPPPRPAAEAPIARTPSPPPAPEAAQSRPAARAATPSKTVEAPPARHLDPEEVAFMMRRAEELISDGDLSAARVLLQRVAETHNARAAFQLAETYDPLATKKYGGAGSSANPTLAQQWYQRAKDWGSPDASKQLDALASRAAESPK